MPPAVAAAGIAAGATIGGAVLGSKAQKSAANKASDAQDRATQAQIEAARLNAELAREVYNSNLGVLSPYNELGYTAASARNALLGLGAGPAYVAPQPIGTAAAQPTTQTVPVPGAAENALDYMLSIVSDKKRKMINAFQGTPEEKVRYGLSVMTSDDNIHKVNSYIAQNPLTKTETISPAVPATQPPPPTQATPAIDYEKAFKQYLDSAGYKFQLGEGQDAINHALRLSSVDSGAAVKAAAKYANNLSTQFFNNYMGLLGQQQGMGLGAASAIAGQGSQYAANMANANNATGNALASGAIGQGNLALAMGANQAAMYGNIANALGNAAGQIWAPSSYGSGPNAWGVYSSTPNAGIY